MQCGEVGFKVILLDSKLYPLIANESTAGIDSWKSTHKIIATSRAAFEKIVGKSQIEELSQAGEEVIIVEPQTKKPRVMPNADDNTLQKVTAPIIQKLDELQNAVSHVNQKTCFLG